jgi:methyl-accepting chemotaxis protein
MFGFMRRIGSRLKLFSRFRIGLRIQIALVGTIGVLVTGSICLIGLQLAANTELESLQLVHLREHVTGLSAGYLEAGELATEFLRKHDEKLVARHADIVKVALQNLSEIEGFADQLEDGDPLKKSGTLRSGLNLYQTRFQNIVAIQRTLGLNENEGLQGKLRAAVHNVEDKLGQFDEPRLTVLMLMMRRHEKDFMLRGDVTRHTATSSTSGSRNSAKR